jgi:hypothetical protein
MVEMYIVIKSFVFLSFNNILIKRQRTLINAGKRTQKFSNLMLGLLAKIWIQMILRTESSP